MTVHGGKRSCVALPSYAGQARHGKDYRISPAHSISKKFCQISMVVREEIFLGHCSFEMIILTISQNICDNLDLSINYHNKKEVSLRA
jgi:hypothetical protein